MDILVSEIRLHKVVAAITAATLLVGLFVAYQGLQLTLWALQRGNDTWVYGQGHGWMQSTPTASPPVLLDPAMAPDPGHRQVVMFGGVTQSGNGGSESADTWTWDGHGWTRQPAPGPKASAGASMAHDDAHHLVVLFGGFASCTSQVDCQSSNGMTDETWTWDGRAWTQQQPARHPSAREGAGMAYDSLGHRVILFGGSPMRVAEGGLPLLGDTWAWDGSDWAQLSPPVSPAARAYAVMAADPKTGGILLFGGQPGSAAPGANGALGDTWEWSGSSSSWTQLQVPGPGPRYYAAAASDTSNGLVVLFGGRLGCGSNHADRGCSTDPSLGDTWTWNGRFWFQQGGFGAAAPRARADAAMGFLAAAGVAVLFGGPDPHLLALL